jgi:hypothetical protein
MVARLGFALVGLVAAVGLAPAQPKAAVSPDGTEVLAEGPLAVTVFVKEKTAFGETKATTETGTLLFLTRNGVYFRDTKLNKMRAVVAKKLLAASVETAEPVARPDGKKKVMRWELDPKTAGFAGEALAPAEPDLTPRPGNKPLEQNWFLFHLLGRLQSRVDTALALGDKRQLDYLTARAKALAAYAAENALDRGVVNALEGLADYIREQIDAARGLDELYAEQLKVRRDLIRRAREAEAERRARQFFAGLQLLASALPSYDEYELSDGTIVRVNNGPDVDGVIGGLSGLASAQAGYQYQMGRLAVAQQTFEAGAQKRYQALHDKLIGGRAARAELLRKVGAARFGLTGTVPSDGMPAARQAAAKSKDVKPIIAVFEEQAKFDKGTGPWDNPYALCELYEVMARAIPKGPGRAAAVFELAQKAADAVRLVPPGDIYAPERVEVIRAAARLACMAAGAEAQDGFWCRTFSPRAAYAVRLIDRAGALDELDVTGELREQRAIALLLTGHLPAALEQAQAVGKLRATSGAYHYALARLHSAQYWAPEVQALDPKERPRCGKAALESLEEAFKYGFSNLRELKEGGLDSDFYALFTDADSKGRVREILKPDVSYSVSTSADKITLLVSNKSAFTLTNVTGSLDPRTKKDVPLALVPAGATIRPGREGRFEVDISKVKNFDFRNWNLTLGSDQGKLPAKYVP